MTEVNTETMKRGQLHWFTKQARWGDARYIIICDEDLYWTAVFDPGSRGDRCHKCNAVQVVRLGNASTEAEAEALCQKDFKERKFFVDDEQIPF